MESRIERQCVANGLKMTHPRRVIAQVLSDVTDHPDVDELHRLVHQIDPRISLATVYRTVRLFEQSGILERRNLGSRRARYEPSGDRDHFHLVDRETGMVIEFDEPETEALMRRLAARHGYELISLKIELFGRRIKSEPTASKPPASKSPASKSPASKSGGRPRHA
ncbi:MAG TPA: Fur family transcriptional regulator [Acidiphilium sp.]|nr:MAG: transcriptional repressor [Acidiphilium sp. 21-60-14]OYV91036.1 MAG: transcriptional repressor [Acidiphilium sp. 37-60-79]OZB40130.1 MAG: transcriptional repressor [Acidiphilium sp. 34-60-192]HQT87830.1 Fur family transcriptional regulator [Acidiphilium sp.]